MKERAIRFGIARAAAGARLNRTGPDDAERDPRARKAGGVRAIVIERRCELLRRIAGGRAGRLGELRAETVRAHDDVRGTDDGDARRHARRLLGREERLAERRPVCTERRMKRLLHLRLRARDAQHHPLFPAGDRKAEAREVRACRDALRGRRRIAIRDLFRCQEAAVRPRFRIADGRGVRAQPGRIAHGKHDVDRHTAEVCGADELGATDERRVVREASDRGRIRRAATAELGRIRHRARSTPAAAACREHHGDERGGTGTIRAKHQRLPVKARSV